MTRKIAVVTGTRAEYGLLYWILREIQDASDLQLQLLVTGAHLAPTFGRTADLIHDDGFAVDGEVSTLLASDTPEAVAKAIALGVIGFADCLGRIRPDLVLLNADRSETFAAAVAAVSLGVAIAHLGGGEATQGLFDDQFRHAITKMAHLHFTTTESYRQRVIQMGEDPTCVFAVGEPGLDHCVRTPLVDCATLSRDLGLDFSRPVALVSFHPVTLELGQTGEYVGELLAALERFRDLQKLFTYPGADPTSHVIIDALERFVASDPKARLCRNLGFRRYLSALRHARLIVGNSSSGIVEAPSFGTPAVNLGSRQGGRIRGRNVIDVECTAEAIAEGISRGLTPEFRASLSGMENPYGDGDSSRRIVGVLRSVDIDSLRYKRFFELTATQPGR